MVFSFCMSKNNKYFSFRNYENDLLELFVTNLEKSAYHLTILHSFYGIQGSSD